jgi:hypothetical protein
MMFHHTGHVPANTTHIAPLHEQMKICNGTIKQWVLYQPEECANLLKFWVVYHGTQLFPFNPNEQAYGFFIPTLIDDEIRLPDSPWRLDLYAINTDDSYEHEYHVYVNVEAAEYEAPAVEGESSLYTRLKSYFGEL